MSLLVVFIVLFQHLLLVESNPKFSGETTWLFTFGDSTVDLGYNAHMNCSTLNANYYPYGIDSVGSSGRFSDGYALADLLGTELRLPFLFYYGATNISDFGTKLLIGYNYACGPAGILPSTAYSWGVKWHLNKQVELFNITVQKNLPKLVQKSAQHYLTNSVYDYLTSSVYAISFGTSDYVFNYLQTITGNINQEYNPQQFAALLVNKLGSQIKTLYELGARYFMVFEVGPIGCYPFIMKKYNSGTKCVDEVNNMVMIYNQRLDNKIRKLKRMYNNTNFVTVRVFNIVRDMTERPSLYGFKNVSEPCCGIRQDGTGQCLNNEDPCLDRKRNLFWDSLHLTATANKIIMNKCFHGSNVCEPTIRNLFPSGSRQTRTSHFLVNLLLVVMISIMSCLYI